MPYDVLVSAGTRAGQGGGWRIRARLMEPRDRQNRDEVPYNLNKIFYYTLHAPLVRWPPYFPEMPAFFPVFN